MNTTIKVLRENVVKALSSIKDDNVSIADVTINRRKLLEALKLQTQPNADIITLTYGKVSWQDSYKNQGHWQTETIDNESCVQFSCDHTTMRFLNRPKIKNNLSLNAIPLNFIDYRANTTKQELTGIAIDTLELLNAVTFVSHGVATDGTRPIFECIQFDCEKNKVTLVAADGFRLPITTIVTNGMTKKQALIHRKDIPQLVTFLKSNIQGKGRYRDWLTTYIDIRQTETMFISEKGMVSFDNQTGTYPNYDQLIPKTGTHIQIIASDMLKAVKALTTIVKDTTQIIRLQFSKYPDKLTLSVNNEDIGNSSVECLALVDKECHIAINASYLTAFLTTCKDNPVDLFITHNTRPMVCYNGQAQFEVIMPMFVQW